MNSTTLPALAPLRKLARRSAKRLIGRYPRLMVPTLLAYNLWWEIRLRLGRSDTEFNALIRQLSADEAVRYIEHAFSDYQRFAGFSSFHGNAVELGPGGNAGVALLLRQHGCDHVDLVDRYVIRADPARQAEIYSTLSARHDLNQFATGPGWDDRNLSGITWWEGESSEAFFQARAASDTRTRVPGYSFIGSTTVLQHLFDPLGSLRDMIACLEPGGRSVHLIDLSDQGFFSQASHELTWLTVSDQIWPWLTRSSGMPNRVLLHQYRAVLDELERRGRLRYTFHVTRLVEVGRLDSPRTFRQIDAAQWEAALSSVEKMRGSFARELRWVPGTDLAVTEVILAVERL